MKFRTLVQKLTKNERKARLVILGPDNAGKTTLLMRFLNASIEDTSPTFGYQVFSHAFRTTGGAEMDLRLLDVGGQKSLRAYWDTYYEKTDGIVFVYDCDDDRGHKDLLEKIVRHPTLYNAEFVCIANKADSVEDGEGDGLVQVTKRTSETYEMGSLPFDFMVQNAPIEVEEHLKEEQCALKLFSCSALTGANVRRAFEWILLEIAKKNSWC